MKFVMSKRQKIAMLMIAFLIFAAAYSSGIKLALAVVVASVCICLSLYRFPFSIERTEVTKEELNKFESTTKGPSQAEMLELEVARLEDAYYRDPGKYKYRVILLGVLGYSYVVVMAIVLVGLIVAIAKIPLNVALIAKPGFLALIGLFLIAKSLWVKFPVPSGIAVDRAQAPRLFELIEKIRRTADSPRIDKVIVSTSFNCSIAQVPRLGPFGFHANYLELGLPLMSALSVEHFTAVLAHEMGHLSALHGKFTAWICHVQMSWSQLFKNFAESNNVLLMLFTRFGNWFFPLFEATSLVYRRQQEYQADQIAKSLVGEQITAQALVTVVLKGARDDRTVLRKMWDMLKASPDVPSNGLELLINSKKVPLSADEAQEMLRLSENGATVTDSHPSLIDRVRALGIDVEKQDIIELAQIDSARDDRDGETSDALFGSSLPSIREELSKLFCSEFQPSWTYMHESLSAMREELTQLNDREALRPLTEDEEGKRAIAIASLGSPESSIDVLLRFLDRYPNNAGVAYDLGTRLLDDGDQSGVQYILKAIETEPCCAAEGYGALFEFSAKYGTKAEAQEYLRKQRVYAEESSQAMFKYATLSELDKFDSHNMSAERIETIRSIVSDESAVRRVWVVDRILPKILGDRQSVVVIQLGGPVWKYRDNNKIMLPIHERLKMADIYLIEHSDIEPNLGSACKNISGALIYDSTKESLSDRRTPVRM